MCTHPHIKSAHITCPCAYVKLSVLVGLASQLQPAPALNQPGSHLLSLNLSLNHPSDFNQVFPKLLNTYEPSCNWVAQRARVKRTAKQAWFKQAWGQTPNLAITPTRK